MELCNRSKEKVYTKEEKDVSIVKKREKRGIWVHRRTIKKRVYQIFKVILNSTSVFCRKEE